MKPTIFIHIGAAKCGSSSLQAYLSINKDKLEKQGLIIPDDKLKNEGPYSGQQIWFYENLVQNPEEGKKIIRMRINGMKQLMEKKGAHKLVLSAENLSNRQGFHHLFADLRNDFDIKVIMYIRRQDEYLLSSWQQWYVKNFPDIWTWLLYVIGKKGNWYHDLEPWINIYGAENLIVRVLSKDRLVNADLIDDFSYIIGVDAKKLDTNVGMRNPSYNDAVTNLAGSIKDIFNDIHDNDFYQMISDWGGVALQKKVPSALLSTAQRHAILTHYKDSNDKIKKLFFPEINDENLFEQIKGNKLEISEYPDINEYNKIVTRLLYGNYKELKKIKEKYKI